MHQSGWMIVTERKRDWRWLWLRYRTIRRGPTQYEHEVLSDPPIAYWAGDVTEVEKWNRPLSPEEIKEHYTESRPE